MPSAPVVFASHIVENNDRIFHNRTRPAVWRQWVGKGMGTFALGDVEFDFTKETNVFIFTGEKKWRTALYGRHVPRQAGLADDEQWEEVAFEEGTHTKAFVEEYSRNPPTLDGLARFSKRILVRSRGPAPPPVRIITTTYDGFKWENRPVLYWGTKVDMYEDGFGVLEGRAKGMYDLDKTAETPNLFAVPDPDNYREGGRREERFSTKFIGNYAEKGIGKLKLWYDAWRADRRRRVNAGEEMNNSTEVAKFVKENLEWRCVLINIRYSHERKLTPDTNHIIEENYSLISSDPVSPIIDLATFNKKADSVVVSKMAGKWDHINIPGRNERMRVRAEAERNKRDELKQEILAKVLHPERVLRVSEMYGLSMDEYLERV